MERKAKKIKKDKPLVASTADLKRSFFENNLCGLDFKRPSEHSKRHGNKRTPLEIDTTLKDKVSCKSLTSNSQLSIFREIENQPEARQWVQQRKGKQSINGNLSSSLEYDGDVFLPSGIMHLHTYI